MVRPCSQDSGVRFLGAGAVEMQGGGLAGEGAVTIRRI